jgi:tetratricopeptide (TPR) repeat protein
MRASQFAAVYSRLALELTPDDEHRLHYAEALASARLNGTARGVLGQIGTAQPEIYTNAQAQLGESLARAGRQDEALLAYQRAVAASPASVPASLALAGQLVSMERNREALAVLDGPTLGSTAQTGFLRFLRGAAYEGLGFSQEAEAELLAAVTAQPDNPMYLNYLGYLWVDSGSRIDEGAALISRAFNALPADGNIQDSLGWAQYRQGRFEQAVETLEGAVSKEPANAEINDHLGDAYWQVGRRREAGFQWRRVLTLDPDDERKASVERKLVEGLVLPQTTSPQSGSAPGADTI